MATDTTVNNLIINKLTKAQYDAIESPSETELYLVPDEIDTTPTSGSENPVTSGGVYTALSGKADSSSLSTVATSGSYNDLSDKPTIPAAQVQSDWNATSGLSQILNRPSVATTPTSGSTALITSGGVYSALSGKQSTIDSSHKLSADLVEDGTTNKVYTATEKTKLSGIAEGAEVNVQADWDQTTTTADDYIKNKPSITQVNSPVRVITISGYSNSIVVGDDVSIGRSGSTISIGSSGGDNDRITLESNGADGGVYVSTTNAKFYYNDKEVATKNDIPDAQIQSDWNQTTTTAKDYIKNKPTALTNSEIDSTQDECAY